jgi:membrane dipeptidase
MGVAGCLLAALFVNAQPTEADGVRDEILELLRAVPLVDGHNDAPWSIRSRVSNHLKGFDFKDTTGLDKPMHTDLTRLRAGGVGGVFWSVWVPPELEGGEAVTAVLEQIDVVHRLIRKYPEDLEIALTADDVRRIHSAGRIASLIGAEGGYSIDDSLAVLRQLYAVGTRYMTLTHWSNVGWADAATDAPRIGGLSEFGEAVVREMNRLGMMVDLSHVSEQVMVDVLDLTRAPVIFSHSSAKSLNPHPRNVSDDVLRKLSANDGVVMVNFASLFISSVYLDRYGAAKAEEARLEAVNPGDPALVASEMERWYEANPIPSVPLAEVADHIDHIRDVAGIDHVGLGSDYDGVSSLPEGLGDVSGYPALLAELANRGYSVNDLAQVAGLNVLRVMEAVEDVAAELQRTEDPIDLRFDEVEAADTGHAD